MRSPHGPTPCVIVWTTYFLGKQATAPSCTCDSLPFSVNFTLGTHSIISFHLPSFLVAGCLGGGYARSWVNVTILHIYITTSPYRTLPAGLLLALGRSVASPFSFLWKVTRNFKHRQVLVVPACAFMPAGALSTMAPVCLNHFSMGAFCISLSAVSPIIAAASCREDCRYSTRVRVRYRCDQDFLSGGGITCCYRLRATCKQHGTNRRFAQNAPSCCALDAPSERTANSGNEPRYAGFVWAPFPRDLSSPSVSVISCDYTALSRTTVILLRAPDVRER